MAIDTTPPLHTPEPMDYIVHWAQWWGITEQNLLGTPCGTLERSKANKLHEAAKGNLRHSLGICEREVKS
jgi:hypothetical protein